MAATYPPHGPQISQSPCTIARCRPSSTRSVAVCSAMSPTARHPPLLPPLSRELGHGDLPPARPRRREEVREAQPIHDPPRCGVLRFVDADDAVEAARREPEFHRGGTGLRRQTLPPLRTSQAPADLDR